MNFLIEKCKEFQIDLSESQVQKFKIYMNFLLDYNNHTNLTAIKNPEDIMIKHFLDSMLLNKFIKPQSSVIDIGTGAGFPGVPLKILYGDNIKLTMIDSLNKRVIFLNELIKKIDVKAEILHARAEELSHKENFREKFDFAVSRAVAQLNILSEYCLPYVKIGGNFIAMKGPSAKEEIEFSENAIKTLGGKITAHKAFNLPDDKGTRNIIVVKKATNTLKKYPRSNSQISKNPL